MNQTLLIHHSPVWFISLVLLKVEIRVIFRQKSVIDNMTSFILKAVIIRIADTLRKTEQIIEFSVINIFTDHAIRMAVKQNGTVTVQSGGGIVADSVPELEYEESANKAMAVINAIKNAGEVDDK